MPCSLVWLFGFNVCNINVTDDGKALECECEVKKEGQLVTTPIDTTVNSSHNFTVWWVDRVTNWLVPSSSSVPLHTSTHSLCLYYLTSGVDALCHIRCMCCYVLCCGCGFYDISFIKCEITACMLVGGQRWQWETVFAVSNQCQQIRDTDRYTVFTLHNNNHSINTTASCLHFRQLQVTSVRDADAPICKETVSTHST